MSLNLTDLLAALGLFFVFEGIAPFLNPRGVKRAFAKLLEVGDPGAHPWFDRLGAINAAREGDSVDSELEARLTELARTRELGGSADWAPGAGGLGTRLTLRVPLAGKP